MPHQPFQSSQVRSLSPPDWQRLAWEKHHQQCKRSRLSDIHLYGEGVSVSPRTIDFLLDDAFTQRESPGFGHTSPSNPPSKQSLFHHDREGREAEASSSPAIRPADEEEKAPVRKDESAAAATEKIIAGQCICCNTVFQLEIMEKVGTIDNVDVEIRKLQQGGQARMRESYGSVASQAGVDYTPRDNRESRITYDAAPSSSSYDVSSSSGDYK